MLQENFDAGTARRVLISVCISLFFLPFMLAGVNTVLPDIGKSLGAGAQELGILSMFYTLGLAVSQLATGRMGDVWGRKRLYLAGLLLFSVTGLLQAFTNSFGVFTLLRFLQGCGGAAFSASSLALLASVAPPELRGRYIGLSSAAVYAGIACGPPLAGFIAGILSWQWLFLICSAAAIANIFLMACSVKEEWCISAGEPFDWPGCLCYTASMACLVYGSSLLQKMPLTGWGFLFSALVLFIFFCRHSWKSPYPLLQLRLFTLNRVFRLSSLASFINYSSLFAIMLFFSLYLQTVQGYSVQTTGLILAVQALIQVLVSPWAGVLSDRYGAGKISAAGIALCGTGILFAVFMHEHSGIWHILVVQLISGTGISLFSIPNTVIILDSAGKEYLGQASSVTGAVRTGGMLLSMIILTTTLGAFLGNAPVSRENIPQFLHAMRADFILFGLLNIAAIGCALARERRGKSKTA